MWAPLLKFAELAKTSLSLSSLKPTLSDQKIELWIYVCSIVMDSHKIL